MAMIFYFIIILSLVLFFALHVFAGLLLDCIKWTTNHHASTMVADWNNKGHDGMDNCRSSVSHSQDATEHFPTIGAIADTVAASEILPQKSLPAGGHHRAK